MPDQRLQRFVGGLSIGYLQTAVVAVVALWLTPYLLRHVGEHEFGLWLVGGQALSYLALADLGIVALLPREIAHATGAAGRPEAPRVSAVVQESATIVACQMPVVAIVGVVAWLLIGSQWMELRGPLAVAVVAFVLSFPLRVFPAMLQGFQDLPYLGGVQLVTWVISSAVTVVLVEAGHGLYAIAAGWVVTQVLVVALSFRRLVREFPTTVPSFFPTLWTVGGFERVGRGLWVSVNQIAQVLLNGTDLMVVGWLLGPAAVVMYSCTGRLATTLANQPQMFMQMAVPALSELRAAAPRARLFEVSSAMSQAMLLGSGAIACVVIGVNQEFVSWWVGRERFGGSILTVLMLLSMMLRHLNVAVSYTLYSLGHERRLALTGIADGVVTVSSMFGLVPLFGLRGAVMGTIVGVSLISLPANVRTLAREEGVSIVVALRHLKSWAIRCGALLFIVGMSVNLWPPHSVWLVVAGAAIAAGYLVSMLPVLSAPPIGPMLARVIRPFLTVTPASAKQVNVATPSL